MPDTQPPDWAPEAPGDWPPPPPGGAHDPTPDPAAAPDPTPDPAAAPDPAPTAPENTAAPPGHPVSSAVPQEDRPRERAAEPLDRDQGWVPPTERPRRGRGGCLIAVAVLVVVLVLGVGGCVYSCRGALSGAYKIGIWGWSDGEGPSLQSADTTHLGTQALPQDRMQPDKAKDHLAEQGLVRIHDGLLAFERDRGRPYDKATDGSWERALEPYVTPWPANPWTQQPMREGLHRGDVQLDQSSGELSLTIYISP
jgi:hypothetical protein